MILGLGLDLISIARIRKVLDRRGERFLARVYTAEEQTYCLSYRDPAERLAGRWAAKEACMKALGSDSEPMSFTDISLLVSSTGAPVLRLTGMAQRRSLEMGVTSSLVTLSHSDGMAIAVVVLQA